MQGSKPAVKSLTHVTGLGMYAGLVALILQSSGLPITEAVIAQGIELIGATALWVGNIIGRNRAKQWIRGIFK